MPDITETQVRVFIATQLVGDPPIEADAHRAVENKIMDFVVQEIGKTAKVKSLVLESFTTDRNYSVSTGLTAGEIQGVTVMLVCKTANNNFSPNDTVTVSTPYPRDAGRTTAQGIGVQFSNVSVSAVKVMVNKEITIMTAYDATPGAEASHIGLSDSETANWSIKLIITYK